MKKKILSLFLGLALAVTGMGMSAQAEGATSVEINDTTFPDPEFQRFVSTEIDKDTDGVLSAEEIATATDVTIDCWDEYYWLESLDGLNYLTGIKKLDINGAYVFDIDVTNLKDLEELNIEGTYFTSIDLSQNTKLTKLKAKLSQLKSIDLTNNTKLEYVNLIQVKIPELKVDTLPELKELLIDGTKITSLDVTKNPKLETLDMIAVSGVTSLDLSKNPALKKLEVSGTGLTELSLASNTALEDFRNASSTLVAGTKAAPIKGLDISHLTSLKTLKLEGTDLSHMGEIDLANYPNLNDVTLVDAGLNSVKFNDNVTYKVANISGNKCASADMPKMAEGKTAKWGTQTVTAKVPSTDTLETYDLNNLVDIKRAEVVTSEDIEYNAETGIITFKGDKKAFSYKYAVDEVGTYKMDVNVTVEKKTVEEEAAEKEAADKAAAQPVIDKIAAIGKVTLESEKAIAEAREAYDALTDDQKKLVTNYEDLTKAEASLKALKEEAKKPATPDNGKDDTKPGNNEGGSNTVKTGDTAMIIPYIIAMAAALLVIGRRKFNR